jgi:hypothetical protein
MAQNAVDDARVGNKGDDAHPEAARAQQRIGLENLPDQPRPRAARFPGTIRILPLWMLRCRQAGGHNE